MTFLSHTPLRQFDRENNWLPEAFVYIHVDVTHADDFLFICP
jgi:hypothetical protein